MNSYDAFPYTSHPFPHSHPACLAAIAALGGLSAAPVGKARILELGCAGGGNIIPLACNHPNAAMIGIDSSAVQIEAGQRTVEALSLSNIELRHADILSLDHSLGKFDFIICHGVFSWVPAPVQDKILWMAANLLTQEGIVYISYNTYPGWHMRGIVRDLMLLHTSPESSPEERVAAARAVLNATAKLSAAGSKSYGEFLRAEAEALSRRRDDYIYHEHLASNCEPFYFHDFISRARKAGLNFLGEADLTSLATARFSPVFRRILPPAADVIQCEQYVDFIWNRFFRETLLCHAHRQPSYELRSRTLWPLYLASSLRPVEFPVDIKSDTPATFTGPSGESLSALSSLLKAALLELSRHWPASISFEQLLQATSAALGIGTSAPHWVMLAEVILSVITKYNLLELSTEPSAFTLHPSTQPLASRLARHQAATGTIVTNMRYERVELTSDQRDVLLRLDGARDLEQAAQDIQLPLQHVRDTVSNLAQLALLDGTGSSAGFQMNHIKPVRRGARAPKRRSTGSRAPHNDK